MRVWDEYAIISNGEIKNVICYHTGDGGALLSQVEAVREYGQSATSVNITYYKVGIGDTYRNGKFYKIVEGVETEVEATPTEEAEIANLNETVDDILIEILGG